MAALQVCAKTASPHRAPTATGRLLTFADQRHTMFYGRLGSCTPSSAAAPNTRPRHRSTHTAAAPTNFTTSFDNSSSATGGSGRRARLMQQVASVEETLRRLEEGAAMGPLPGAEAALPSYPAAAAARRRRAHARASSSSSSSESSSESSSDSEAEQQHSRAAASRLGRRLQAELTARRDAAAAAAAAGNIVPAPALAAAVAPVAAPATTVVRVCTGKKCSAGGAAAVLATLGSQPGVTAVAAPKCMGQCKRCLAVKMAAPGSPGETLYTGVSASNAPSVLAMHQQQHAPLPHRHAQHLMQ